MTGDPGKQHGTNKPPPTGRVQERSKGDTTCPTTSQNPSHWCPSWLTRKDWSECLAKDNPETNPITVKPETVSHVAVLLGSLTLLLSARVPLSNKLSCFVRVSLDNSFLSVRREPTFGPLKEFPFLQQMATLAGTLLHYDWHPDHSGYSGTSLLAEGPDPVTTSRTLLSLVSWCRQLARVPQSGKEQEILLTSLPSSLSFLSLTLLLYPFFLVPWSWTQESGRRASTWAED